ncbi:Cytochrome c7 c [uncultured archaeon]|nr:Cytochrome c7 c [uncultured archaeon]
MKQYRTILQLVFVTIAIFAFFVVIFHEMENRVETPQVQVRHNDAKVENNPASNLTIYVSGDVCEGCHMSGKPFIPQALTVKAHAGGGAYCLSCHKISHEKHPINANVTCEKCHGTTTPGIPVFVNGSIPCNNCHGYPDPLLPSGGNLITIHRARGVACTNCHTDECTKCHSEIGTDAKWEKRLTHFRTIVGT